MSPSYLSTADHVFRRVAAIRERALALLEGQGGHVPPGADPLAESRSEEHSIELRLPLLARRFGLTALEVDALVCLVAAEYDPVVRTLERALQREAGRPWLELGTLAELLDLPTERVPELARALYGEAPLRRWALVLTDDPTGTDVPAVFTRVKIATRIARHLIGQDHLPEGIVACDPPRPLLARSLVAPAVTTPLLARLRRAVRDSEPLVVEIVGVPGTGRRDYAEGLAHELGMSLVLCDLEEQPSDRASLDERIVVARREAALCRALLGIAGWVPRSTEGPTEDEGRGPPRVVERRLPRALEKLAAAPDRVLFLFAEEREPLLSRAASVLLHVQVPFPTPGQRAALLEEAVSALGARIDPSVDANALTRRFALDPSRIEVAARAARELAVERTAQGEQPVLSTHDLQEACRHQLRHDLKSLAQRVTNAHKWTDLVIPVDVYHSLREMISYVRHAERVYDRWGFGARHSIAQGVSALFAGPPGTGKTMCASVMARELDMELFRVDLSRVVSKWIGETEKNLGKIFDEADRSNAIILFDEADSLFAKRTEVKSSVDRYANLEINFLLQRMEQFGGITILTTNFEDTIDTAFKRRLTFRMRFEKPDADARTALWQKIFPRDAELANDLDMAELGALYELAGGNIRNAAVRAAFMAAEAGTAIDQRTCMLAAEREAREMGLLVRSHVEPRQVTSEDEPVPPRPERFTNLGGGEGGADAPVVPTPAPRSKVISVTRPRRTQ